MVHTAGETKDYAQKGGQNRDDGGCPWQDIMLWGGPRAGGSPLLAPLVGVLLITARVPS